METRVAPRLPCARDVHLVYRTEYVCDVLGEGFRHTFDIERPRRIRDGLVRAGLVEPARFLAPPPVSHEQLRLVHTDDYIARLHDPDALARMLLLDPSHPWDARLLDAFRYASGGTVLAARLATAHRGIGVNLSGGFHHAQADKAEGFCAIADVAIAIRQLQADDAVERVLIVDLDWHHGNGNALLFAEDERVFTFSMHGMPWCFLSKRNNLDIDVPLHVGDDAYLRTLVERLPPVLHDFRPDLVVYVAGTDPFVGDTLGQADLTESGIFRRDRFVTEQSWGAGIPLVVVTAGGYGTESWRMYVRYFSWLLGRAPEHDAGEVR